MTILGLKVRQGKIEVKLQSRDQIEVWRVTSLLKEGKKNVLTYMLKQEVWLRRLIKVVIHFSVQPDERPNRDFGYIVCPILQSEHDCRNCYVVVAGKVCGLRRGAKFTCWWRKWLCGQISTHLLYTHVVVWLDLGSEELLPDEWA